MLMPRLLSRLNDTPPYEMAGPPSATAVVLGSVVDSGTVTLGTSGEAVGIGVADAAAVGAVVGAVVAVAAVVADGAAVSVACGADVAVAACAVAAVVDVWAAVGCDVDVGVAPHALKSATADNAENVERIFLAYMNS